MLYNTTLNPLGAILNMSYGELASSQHLVGIINRMIEETFAVMDAAGYKTFWKNAQEYQEVFYGKLLPDTFAHRSSTLQDIEKGHRTEISMLNGCLIRLGEEHHVPTPTHKMIVELIRGIEDIRLFRRCTLCTSRKRLEIRAQIFQEMPQANCAVLP